MSEVKRVQVPAAEYEEAVAAIGKIAHYTHGLKISPKTQERWRQTMLLIYYIDKASDVNGANIKDLKSEIKTFFLGSWLSINNKWLTPEALQHARFLKGELSKEQLKTLVGLENKIISICNKYPSISRPSDYAKQVMDVGEIVAKIFFSMVNDAETSQPEYKNFKNFFLRAGRISTVIDALTDLDSDYREGQVRVHPYLINRLIIISSTIPDVWHATREIGAIKLWRLIRKTNERNKYYQKQTLANEG